MQILFERYLHAIAFWILASARVPILKKNETGCKAGDRCLFPHHKVDEQPKKKTKKSNFPKRRESDDENAVAVVKSVSQLGCVSQDSDALVSQGRTFRGNPMKKVLEPIQWVRFTKSTLRQASIREKKGPSLGKINVKNLHQRSPYAVKFEDRSHEETERQQRCARSKAWNLAKNKYKLKEKDKAAFRGRMGDFNSAELETTRTSRSPTTVMTASGEVQTREQARVCVKQVDLVFKVILLEETPAVFPWETLWESWVYTLDQLSETTSHQKWHENWLQYIQLCTICGFWFITEFFFNYTFTYFSIIFITGFRIWCQQIHRNSSTNKKWKYEWRATERPAAWNHRNRKQKEK